MPIHRFYTVLAFWLLTVGIHLFSYGVSCAATKPETAAQIERGAKVYSQICSICHQISGQGMTGVFPPLAGSDYLMENDTRVIRDLIIGLRGNITVNGVNYNNVMPPSGLDDRRVADVLTYVRNAWGNQGGALSEEMVRKVRSELILTKDNVRDMEAGFASLPPVPDGFQLQELAQTPEHCVRLASYGDPGQVYVLSQSGNVWKLDTDSGDTQPVLHAEDYLGKNGGNVTGMAFDRQRRLYIVINRLDGSEPLMMNRVTIFRTEGTVKSEPPAKPRPWLQVSYPFGLGAFAHGAGHIALGPDGMLYCGSGSRTDGNEPGNNARFSTAGEHELTSCLWRLDPEQANPKVEIYARGLRNPYGFCWTPEGEMFVTDNGPDADPPEELNVVQRGGHYGFPYEFSDWVKKVYPYTPDAPAGLKMTKPVINMGPDGGFSGTPMATFSSHSSPAGICYLDDSFPEMYRGSFLISRFGNMIKKPEDAGFDVLLVKVAGASPDRTRSATVKTLLPGLGRPLDVLMSGPGTALILEYSRSFSNSGPGTMLPGRILKLKVANGSLTSNLVSNTRNFTTPVIKPATGEFPASTGENLPPPDRENFIAQGLKRREVHANLLPWLAGAAVLATVIALLAAKQQRKRLSRERGRLYKRSSG